MQIYTIPDVCELRFVDSPQGCERPHTHNSLILSAVTGGTLFFRVNETEICLNPGRVAVVGPNILHCVHVYSPDFAGVYVLKIFKFPNECAGLNENHFHAFGSRLFETKQLYGSYITLCFALLGNNAESGKIKILVKWLGSLLLHRFNSNPYIIQGGAETERLAMRIKNILDQCTEPSPPYKDIAKACGCGKENCNRIFKRSYNLSIQTYFLNKKAAMARDLMGSVKELAEIAHLCGFYDQSHLTRVFKGIYQVSPQKYREAVHGPDHYHTRRD